MTSTTGATSGLFGSTTGRAGYQAERLPEIVGFLAAEAAPQLGSVAVEARPIEGLSVVLLQAEAAIGTFEGSGRTVRDAAGDVLATIEETAHE